jgi:hypothetical protein
MITLCGIKYSGSVFSRVYSIHRLFRLTHISHRVIFESTEVRMTSRYTIPSTLLRDSVVLRAGEALLHFHPPFEKEDRGGFTISEADS